jgi:hypothetical protein
VNSAADPIKDQVDAASRDAEERFLKAVKAMNETYTETAPGSVLKTVVEQFMERLHAPGVGRKCPHIGNAPQVIFGSACVPGVIGCSECTMELASLKHQLDQVDGNGRTCDHCKRKAREGQTGMAQHGPLLLQVSLCNPCLAENDAHPLSEDERKMEF